MNRFVIAFLVSMTLAVYAHSLASPALLCLSFVAAVSLAYWRHWLLTGLFAGYLWAGVLAQQIIANELPADFQGINIEVIGRIVGIPRHTSKKTQFYFVTEKFIDPNRYKFLNRRLKLSWYKHDEIIKTGQSWQLTVRLKQKRSLLNPAGFDYEKWLIRNAVFATGYVRNKAKNVRLEDADAWSLDKLRESITERIQNVPISDTGRSFIRALVLGDGSAIKPQHWKWFRQTGTSHLLVISGLHIGLIAAVAAGFAKLIWKLSARIAQPRINRDVFIALSALLVAFIYVLLAGFTVPTTRALIMLSVYFIYSLNKRHMPGLHSYYLALLLVLTLQPLSPLAPGFWLSFSAVLIIYFLSKRQLSKQSGPRQWLFWHTALAVGMLPLTALFFGSASLVAPIANFIAIPLLTLLIVPLVLLGTLLVFIIPPMGELILRLTTNLLDVLLVFIQWLAESRQPELFFTELSWWSYALTILAMLIFLLPRGTGLNWLALPLSASLFFPQQDQINKGAFVVDVLDVGQGLSVWVRTAEHNLLYDTGGRLSRTRSMASAVFIPYFQSFGKSGLDRLVISHTDSDHSAGLTDIMTQVRVKSVITARAFQDELNADEICDVSLQWNWDGVNFQFLNAASDTFSKDNNYSCVLRISNGDASVLLTGDIEKIAENRLLEQSLEPVDLLIAPHHGSKTSSSAAFLDVLQAKQVVYSIAYKNHFRFPHESVSQRYQSLNVEEYRTDRDGMLSFRFTADTNSASVKAYRQFHKEFWRSDFDL